MERIGIAGLAGSGKTSLFNALTRAGAAVGGGSFATKETNVGVASVPDPRLDVLAEMEKSKKVVSAQIEFADVAGLVAGASRGDELGNATLGKLREVDAVVSVLQGFESAEHPHPEGSVDPARDLGTLETALCLADLESAEKAVDRYKSSSKSGDATEKKNLSQAEAIRDLLESGMPLARAGKVEIPPDLFLITDKPVIYVVNIGEDQIEGAARIEEEVRSYLGKVEGGAGQTPEVLAICVQVEAEAADLPDDERAEMLDAYGLGEGVVPRLIRSVYGSLDLLTFLTTGEDETRAWTTKTGSKAPEAAGRIHTDLERGFIRMEVISYDDLVAAGSEKAAKEKGLVRVEGKDYLMQEGDVVHVRFNV